MEQGGLTKSTHDCHLFPAFPGQLLPLPASLCLERKQGEWRGSFPVFDCCALWSHARTHSGTPEEARCWVEKYLSNDRERSRVQHIGQNTQGCTTEAHIMVSEPRFRFSSLTVKNSLDAVWSWCVIHRSATSNYLTTHTHARTESDSESCFKYEVSSFDNSRELDPSHSPQPMMETTSQKCQTSSRSSWGCACATFCWHS